MTASPVDTTKHDSLLASLGLTEAPLIRARLKSAIDSARTLLHGAEVASNRRYAILAELHRAYISLLKYRTSPISWQDLSGGDDDLIEAAEHLLCKLG